MSHDEKTLEERKVEALERIAASLEALVDDPDDDTNEPVGLFDIHNVLWDLCDKLPKLDQKLEDLWTELRGIRTDTTP